MFTEPGDQFRVFIEPGDRAVIAKVYSFGMILHAASALPPDEREYWEKPWKWQPEYEIWLDSGSPNEDDEGWDAFVTRLITME